MWRDRQYFNQTVAKIKTTRSRVEQELKSIGFDVLPSQTNFIFAQPPIEAQEFFEELKKKHIYIRYFKGGRTGRYVRITIGTGADRS